MNPPQNVGTGNETASQDVPQTQQTATAPAGNGAEQKQAQPDAIGLPPPEKSDEKTDPLSTVLPEAAPDEEGGGKAGGEGDGDDPAEPEQPLDIKVPEGFSKDDPLFTGFMEVAKEAGMKQEQAQKLFDMHENAQRGLMDGIQNAIKQDQERINAEWRKECQSDPEFGGQNFTASCNYVTAAIRRFVPEAEQAAFVDFYRQANLQNCPQMFRLFARIGKQTGESGPIASDAAAAPKPNATPADKLYPNLPSARK